MRKPTCNHEWKRLYNYSKYATEYDWCIKCGVLRRERLTASLESKNNYSYTYPSEHKKWIKE